MKNIIIGLVALSSISAFANCRIQIESVGEELSQNELRAVQKAVINKGYVITNAKNPMRLEIFKFKGSAQSTGLVNAPHVWYRVDLYSSQGDVVDLGNPNKMASPDQYRAAISSLNLGKTKAIADQFMRLIPNCK